MEVTGKIIAVLPAQSGVSARTGNPWYSQDYVIEIPGQYPKKMCFNIFGEDRVRQFNVVMNDQVTVQFDIDAREVNGKWFNSIKAYNIIRSGNTAGTAQDQPQSRQDPPPQQPAATQPFPPPQPQNEGEGSADDLPF